MTVPWWIPHLSQDTTGHLNQYSNMQGSNMIGAYGNWAASLVSGEPSPTSWLHKNWQSLPEWKEQARAQVLDKLRKPS